MLANFANLEPDGVERFRAAHREFVPQAWWDYQPTDVHGVPLPDKQWQIAQILVREAWRNNFEIPLFEYLNLIASVFNPDYLELSPFGKQHRTPYADFNALAEEDMSPFHHAVKWLGGQGWRAKTCLFCGKRFMAEHSKTKFCSYGEAGDDNFTANCSSAHRRKYKKEYWSENSGHVNERRRQEYHLEKKRSRRANRKNLRQR